MDSCDYSKLFNLVQWATFINVGWQGFEGFEGGADVFEAKHFGGEYLLVIQVRIVVGRAEADVVRIGLHVHIWGLLRVVDFSLNASITYEIHFYFPMRIHWTWFFTTCKSTTTKNKKQEHHLFWKYFLHFKTIVIIFLKECS